MKYLKLFYLLFFLLSYGCASLTGSTNSDSSQTAQTASQEKMNFYYDFDDVLVPKEMELNPKRSLLFETPQVKAGLISFEGRVEPVSLFDFFRNNMPKDGWQLRSYFKYGRYIIVFEKPEKDCIISISEGTLDTSLEIWVTPRINNVMRPKLSGGSQEQDLLQ